MIRVVNFSVDEHTITLDTYSHAIPALQETAAALIADVVFASKSGAAAGDVQAA